MVARVILVRHAKPISIGYASDALRPLTEEGKVIQKEMALQLKAAGLVPNKILSSPLLRACETAEILSDVFGVPYEEEAALGDEFDGIELLMKIPPPEKKHTLYLVGHEPTLADFAEKLVGKEILPGGLVKSGALVIEFSSTIGFGHGKMISYYTPK